jgi:uncharacterized RDD family membrane protein YckC
MTIAENRAAAFLAGAQRRRSEIVSPEGVPLPIEIASYGERAIAFALDFFFWTVAVAVTVVAVLMGTGKLLHGLAAGSLALFAAFLIRNLYLIHFELAWRGATPGKRIVGLRVMDRRGGPLLPGAVIARNLTREIEFFMPLGFLALAGQPMGDAPWFYLSIAGWMLLFTTLPLFNRDRLRVGDLIAGTMVVALPRRVLLGDLAEGAARYVFAERQLKAYGALELQVLEELLRRSRGADAPKLHREILEKIRRKIQWTTPVPDADTDLFLRDFYAAERAHLEREQLFGRPRASKDSVTKPGA